MEVIMTLVFLADDDILTLNRLRNIIDWNKNGFDIIGQAQNGADTLQQVELLMESGDSVSALPPASGAVAAQIASLQRANEDLKAYLVRYKRSGEEKMAAAMGDYQRLLQHCAALVQLLLARGLVGRDKDAELYQHVQQMAYAVKNANKAQQAKQQQQAQQQPAAQ